MELDKQLATLLLTKKKTVAFAESCTGGSLGSILTSQSGASNYFLGSLVTYSNQLKIDLLGVEKELIERCGAVSSEVALSMLGGLFKAVKADYGVAITGIAGPSGGSKQKPVGTVFIAFGSRSAISCEQFQLDGLRQEIILASCQKAFSCLLKTID